MGAAVNDLSLDVGKDFIRSWDKQQFVIGMICCRSAPGQDAPMNERCKMLPMEKRLLVARAMQHEFIHFDEEFQIFKRTTIPILLNLSHQRSEANCWVTDHDKCIGEAKNEYARLRTRSSPVGEENNATLLFWLWVTMNIPIMFVIIDGQHRLATSVMERFPLDGGPFPGRFFPTKMIGSLDLLSLRIINNIQMRKLC